MGWIEFESLGFFCPNGADVLVGCKSSEGLEPSSEVIGVDEVGEVLAEVLVGFVTEALDGRFFEGAVHAFDLAIGPGMFRLGQAMIDAGFGAGELEGMGAEEFTALEGKLDLRSSRAAIAGRGEMHSFVGEQGVNRIGQELDQCVQEVGRDPLSGLLMHLDEGEPGGPVDGDEEVKLALLGANLGNIDVEVADRVGFELLAPGPVAIEVGQPGDVVPLQAAMQRRAGQLRDGGLKSVEAIVERQQRMPAKGNDNGFLLKGKGRWTSAPARSFGPQPSSASSTWRWSSGLTPWRLARILKLS